MSSPIDIIFNKKQEELELSVPKPKSILLKELSEYVLKTREFTFDKILKEYSTPEKSYPIFNTPDLQKGAIGWSCQYKNDPRFDTHIKMISNGVYQFDFNFRGSGFDKDISQKIEGTNYLNTLHKIIKDKVIPFMQKQQPGVSLFFNINNDDGLGNARKKVFTYLIDKYVNENEFDIDKEGNDFNIIKK